MRFSIPRAAMRGFLLLAVSLLLTPMSASASLLNGETVEYQYLFNTITTLYGGADNGNKLVGAGVEVSNIVDGVGTMDISDTNLFVDFTSTGGFSSGSFNGFRITDIFGAIPAFTSVTINPITNMVGLDASRLTFDADHIWLNWQSLPFTSDTVVSLDINAAPAAAPEPSSLALLAVGAVGVIGLARRRRR